MYLGKLDGMLAAEIGEDLYAVSNIVFYEAKTDIFSKDWQAEMEGYRNSMTLSLLGIDFPELDYRPRVKLDGKSFVTAKHTKKIRHRCSDGTVDIEISRFCSLYLSAKIFKFFESTHVQDLGYVQREFKGHVSETLPSLILVDMTGGYKETEVDSMKKEGLDALAEKLKLEKLLAGVQEDIADTNQRLREIDPLGRITHEYETLVLPAIEKLTSANGG